MLAQRNDAQNLQRLKNTRDFDKLMLALHRGKKQKYKIFSGYRNLDNNAVNKLVNNNYMENFITRVVNMLQFGTVCRHV